MTNGDYIRKMTDEELALTIMCPIETGMTEMRCERDKHVNCIKCTYHWIQEEEK